MHLTLRVVCVRAQDIPSGHPQCFTGKTFVFSGTFDSLSREEAKALVEGVSGRVTGDVSSKSSFLVVGFDCGRCKYDKVGNKPSRRSCIA